MNQLLLMKDNMAYNELIQKESFFWTPDYLDTSAWLEHIPFAFWIIEVLKPKVIVELGVHNGPSYFAFCQAVKKLNINATCYGVDTWKGDEHSGFYEDEVYKKVMGYNAREYSRFSTLIRSTFDEAKDYFIDGSIDLLHIDGLHTYEAVKHDFEAWLPKLTARSIVVFHDINVRERNFGVFKLWEELKQQYRHFQFDFGHGLGILVMGEVSGKEISALFDSNEDDAYYIFLRNLFSERGSSFKNKFDTSVLIKQERENLEIQRTNLLQVIESQKVLELNYNQLQESFKLLELNNNQLNESHQVLGSNNSQLNESYKALELNNRHFNENYSSLVADNQKLKENYAILESDNIQLSENYQSLLADREKLREEFNTLEFANEKNQDYMTELSDKLNMTRHSLNKITKEAADQKTTIKELHKTIQNQDQAIRWYKSTYEDRSVLGLLKEKLKSLLKKKITPDISPYNTFSKILSGNNSLDGGEDIAIKKTRKHTYALLPMNELERLNEAGQYSSTGSDPFFLVDLKNRMLRAGWYWLSFEFIIENSDLTATRIYYDLGGGFNERDVWNLPGIGNGKFGTLIHFPSAIFMLRFDPVTTRCTFKISEFNLKPVNKLGAFRKAVSAYKKLHAPSSGSIPVYAELVRSFLKTGRAGIRKKMREAVINKVDSSAYKEWCLLYDTVSPGEFKKIESLYRALTYQPLFSVIMPVYNAQLLYLRKAIESVMNQAYQHWELCIADDKSTNGNVRNLLEEYQAKDKRIKVIFREVNGHISKASNSALELATGDYAVLLDQDDELPPHCLYMVAKALNEDRNLGLIYSDEDKIDERGNRFDAYFKTDWNKDLFYGQNMISHLGVYKLSLVRDVGGFRAGFEGSQDYDLALRCIEHLKPEQIHHIPHVLYHWRAIEGSTAVSMSNKNYAFEAGLKALNDHLKRTAQFAMAEQNHYNSYRVKWPLPDPLPKVSIIIPTKDKVDILSTCVTSVLQKTNYPNYEVLIIDNNSEEPSAIKYLENIGKEFKQVKVYTYNPAFNFSAIVNYGVQQSTGEVVLLLNNDTEVISEDWLEELVSHVLRNNVGAVGAKLLYPNGLIQHAGIILCEGHPGIHIYRKSNNGDGYVNKLNLIQNYNAVTGACLAVRKELFELVGGLDEQNLTVAYNDVDFCLKLRERGFYNVWTPFSLLYHHEFLSRGDDFSEGNIERFKKEHSYMLNKWQKFINDDSYFNPNLSPDTHTAACAFPPRVRYEWQDKQ